LTSYLEVTEIYQDPLTVLECQTDFINPAQGTNSLPKNGSGLYGIELKNRTLYESHEKLGL